MDRKRKSAFAIAVIGGMAAAGAAATPVPGVSEAAVLGAVVTMVVKIAAVMGVVIDKDSLVPLATSMAGALLTTLAIRLAGGELAKFIPGVGTLAGSLINAGIAGPATYGFGCGFIEYLCRYHIQNHRMPEADEIRSEFPVFWNIWREKEKKLPPSPDI